MIQAITLLVIAALVAIDQVIKIAVVNRFAAGGSMDILFGLIRIRYVENTGAAFSSMQNQTVFLTIFTAVVIVMFIFLLMTKKIKPGFIYWCVAVVIAGGAGNFVDRVARGFVVDYIEPTFVNFAVFNFADCCVTVGAALLIIKTVYDLIRENKNICQMTKRKLKTAEMKKMSELLPGGYSLSFSVDSETADQRIDRTVADAFPELSRSRIQHMAENGCITVNGKIVGKSFKPKADDEVSVYIEPAQDDTALPENIPLDIRYEDDCMLVVNKPKGMVVHPAPGNRSGTLVNALLYHCGSSLSGINGVLRPGIVHRIDKDTSGLLLVAKNDMAHASLAHQIKEHSLTREYAAVVYGKLREPEGVIDAPIGRNPNDRKKMAVTDKNSRPAVTHYYTVEEFEKFTFVRLRLETGRTHQIRVHMAYIGHPVAGDAVYGPKNVITELGGQCLHARLLGFDHPVTGERIELSSELPEYFENFLRKIRK